MLGTLVAKLGSSLLGGIFNVIDDLVQDKDLALQLKTSLQTKVLALLETEIKASRDIIVAEAKSESWIARNWRPLTMLTFVAIIINNYLINPYISLFFPGNSTALELPDVMWELLKIGIGGYIVGRSVEKGVQVWKTSK